MPRLLPPGPQKKLPFSNVIAMRKNPLLFFQKMAEKYGELSYVKIGPQEIVLVTNPELIKTILVTDNDNFIKGRVLEMAKMVVGEGLLTSEGDFHKRQKRLLQPAFHHSKIKNYTTAMSEITLNYCEKWQTMTVIDLNKEIMALTLQIASKTLFDTSPDYDLQKIQNSLAAALNMFNEVINPLAYFFSRLNLRKYRDFDRARAYLDQVIRDLIAERRNNFAERDDLLSRMLQAQDTEGDGTGMSDQQIRDEAMTLFIAGHETTANALSWTFYLLQANPEKEQKLREEIEAVLGDRIPEAEDLPKLKYARMVLTESMRLYPPAWVIARRNIREYAIGDYRFPPSTAFVMSQYLVQRQERYYPEPLKFLPERWTEEFKKSIPRFAYFPFGGGPRACIGEYFAWTEAILLLTIILQHYQLKLLPNQQIREKPLITLRPEGSFLVELKKIKSW